MSVDISKLQFVTEFPIDKIVASGTNSITNPGFSSSSALNGNITDLQIANPYGQNAFVKYVWSIDGVNFNSQDTALIYSFVLTPSGYPSQTQGAYQATTAGVVNPTYIVFQTFNDYHSNVSINTTTNVYTYTAYSLTFTIKWVLYSIS